jgi:hypothetical protein
MDRRLLGIDLGITSAHQAVALAGSGAGDRLEVVVEPSAAVWLPVPGCRWSSRVG